MLIKRRLTIMKNTIHILLSIFISLIATSANSIFAMGLTQVGFKDTVNLQALKKQWNTLTIKDSNGVVFKAPKDLAFACQSIKNYCDDSLAQHSGIVDFSANT